MPTPTPGPRPRRRPAPRDGAACRIAARARSIAQRAPTTDAGAPARPTSAAGPRCRRKITARRAVHAPSPRRCVAAGAPDRAARPSCRAATARKACTRGAARSQARCACARAAAGAVDAAGNVSAYTRSAACTGRCGSPGRSRWPLLALAAPAHAAPALSSSATSPRRRTPPRRPATRTTSTSTEQAGPGAADPGRRGAADAVPRHHASRESDYEERGLLSIAFAPDYATRGRFYVYLTSSPAATIEMREYRRSANPNVADPASDGRAVTIPHSDDANHNGGQLQFGPDGQLYAGTGDGGGGNDAYHHSQDPASLLGKLLRSIDAARMPSRRAAQPVALLVRPGDRRARDRRRRARASTRRSTSASATNYGWPCFEGSHATSPATTVPAAPTAHGSA